MLSALKSKTLLLQQAHAPFVEALVRSDRSVLSFSPRPSLGKLGSSATARVLKQKASSAAICRSRQILLGDLAADLAGMEAGIDPRPTGYRRSLASGGVQVVLDVALAASEVRGKKMRQQGIARTHLPHGRENPTWGAPRIHGELKMLGFDISERTVLRWMRKAPRNPEPAKRWAAFLSNHRESHRRNGFLHRADAHLRSSLLLLRHCP
jgi:hypothetical protein